ncbi:hypothetical protein ANO14919_115130 [Xylariales sp. No.14919]|nr:hypothetical protein ANO14919_115130 [Xylariales sp. No.14919]
MKDAKRNSLLIALGNMFFTRSKVNQNDLAGSLGIELLLLRSDLPFFAFRTYLAHSRYRESSDGYGVSVLSFGEAGLPRYYECKAGDSKSGGYLHFAAEPSLRAKSLWDFTSGCITQP